jgi:hypothetical protein
LKFIHNVDLYLIFSPHNTFSMKNMRCSLQGLLLFVLLGLGGLFLPNGKIKAQPTIVTASNADVFLSAVNTRANVLNCDMVELAALSPGDRLMAITWEDGTQASPDAYVTVIDETTGLSVTLNLPVNSHSPDVVIGDMKNSLGVYDGAEYTLCVVYSTLGGDIIFDTYRIHDITTTTPGIGLSTLTSTMISSGTNIARNPHIDLAPDRNLNIQSTSVPVLHTFAICWDEFTTSTYDLKGVYGDVDAPVATTAFPGGATDIERTDIALMQDASLDYYAYISYVDPAGVNVVVDQYMLGGTTYTNRLSPGGTTAVGYPHIEAQGFGDINSTTESVWSLAIGQSNGTPNVAFQYDDLTGATPVNLSASLTTVRNCRHVAVAAGVGTTAGFSGNIGNNQYTTVLQPTSDTSVYDIIIPFVCSTGVYNTYYEVNTTSLPPATYRQ